MFDINGGEFLIIVVLALVLIGPERLPQYAAQLARLVKRVKSFAADAKDKVSDELGPELADVDWTKLDPRQYDPRRIVRDALLDDGPLLGGARPAGATAVAAVPAAAAAAGSAAGGPGGPAPFDPEAT
ncbi:translocase [Xylanimonas cellulosilytica]|uniref:translocase n=1 Tax=Xylanimonas cellulosilytica TaxID=186189 RepID=UPI00019C0FFD|nr:translocase [Xylanimonas cellulosilytica]